MSVWCHVAYQEFLFPGKSCCFLIACPKMVHLSNLFICLTTYSTQGFCEPRVNPRGLGHDGEGHPKQDPNQ